MDGNVVTYHIKHYPIFDTKLVEEHFSFKDGVPVHYVCTSATNKNASYAADIFYRDTPHPQFGNRYFGLYTSSFHNETPTIMITNADIIETLEFCMVEGINGWEYSQHRHDYHTIEGADCAIDGGRSYYRRVGNLGAPIKVLKVVNGKFVESN